MIVEPHFQTFGGQTTEDHAAGLTDYLSTEVNPETGKLKCTAIKLYGMTPLAGDEKNFNRVMAANEIAALADQRDGSADSGIAHWSISWPVDERPTNDEMFLAAEKVMNKLGFDLSKTKAIMFVHDDKPHRHVHVEISRQHVDGFYTTMGLSQNDRLCVLAGRKAGAEVAHEMGFRPLPNGTYQIVDGVAVRQSKKRSLESMSSNAVQEERRTGQPSYERTLKISLAAAIAAPGLAVGMGHEAFAAHFSAHGITVQHKKGGLVYALEDGGKARFMKASDLGKEVSASAMREFYTPRPDPAKFATASTAPAFITAATSTASGQGWQIWHDSLAAQGITAERQGGTSKDGGKLIFTLASGEKVDGAALGLSLVEIEAEVGTTYRKAKRLRKSKTDAKNLTQAEPVKAEDKTQADPAKVETTAKAETKPQVETAQAEAINKDKDEAAEAVKALYAKGCALSEENSRKIEEYFRESRITKELARQIRRQGWNPAQNEALKQLRKAHQGAKTAEGAAIVAIAVVLKMIPSFVSDLSALGGSVSNAASNAIDMFKQDREELKKQSDFLKKREDMVKQIDPEDAKKIYKAHRESQIDVWRRQNNDARRNDFLISAGIADRLRATGHTQSQIVAILQAGGEDATMAETSGYYAYSAKGDATYEKHKKHAYFWQKLEKDACKSRQNTQNQQHQTHNTTQTARKNSRHGVNMR
ncbi:MAG: hypothetical protein DELT_00586 [Desulfovibrio sp.]